MPVGAKVVGENLPPRVSNNSDNQEKEDYKIVRLNRHLVGQANNAHMSVEGGVRISERDTIHAALRMFYEAKIDDAIEQEERRLEHLKRQRNG